MKSRVRLRRDHPRVCGEHAMEIMSRAAVLGSSPRMRGTPAPNAGGCAVAGIIPAYAGNTSRMNSSTSIPWDHPRVCGEHEESKTRVKAEMGSSPRMRGTLQRCPKRNQPPGIIPAYAGNTGLLVCPCADGGDHPRVCGEHPNTASSRYMSRGSSPRMRGTPGSFSLISSSTGIIPAYAGNTESVCEALVANWDHPRVCGQHAD